MKQKLIIFLLFLNYLPTFAQEKSSSKYVFSLGYGYYDICQKMEDSYLKNSFSSKQKYIYNIQSSLTGPIYAKLEKNISKRMGLGLSIGYDQFSFAADADTYFEKPTSSGNGLQFSGNSITTIPHDGINNSDTIKAVAEKYSYKSLSINIRWNVYFINKEKYQLYVGIGLGYRMNTVVSETNIQKYFPVASTSIRRLPSGLIQLYDLPLGAEVTVGFRGYFYKDLGFYTEVGLAKSLLQGGLCFRVQ